MAKTTENQVIKIIIVAGLAITVAIYIVIGFLISYVTDLFATHDLEIGNSDVVYSVQIADDFFSRQQGLQYVEYLAPNEGMLFVFDESKRYSFWMKNTLIPLDFVWIQDNEIVDITENVQPEPGVATLDLHSYAPNQPVNRVIEFPAGTVKNNGILVGESIIVPQDSGKPVSLQEYLTNQ